MKARVKSTGEIVEVDIYTITKRGKMFGEVTDSRRLCKPDSTFRKFYRDEIEFLSYEDTPDYWTRLEHQYAGMAMQGMLVSHRINRILENVDVIPTGIAMLSRCIAHALVEELKGKEEK
jgi:hypothetical protein